MSRDQDEMDRSGKSPISEEPSWLPGFEKVEKKTGTWKLTTPSNADEIETDVDGEDWTVFESVWRPIGLDSSLGGGGAGGAGAGAGGGGGVSSPGAMSRAPTTSSLNSNKRALAPASSASSLSLSTSTSSSAPPSSSLSSSLSTSLSSSGSSPIRSLSSSTSSSSSSSSYSSSSSSYSSSYSPAQPRPRRSGSGLSTTHGVLAYPTSKDRYEGSIRDGVPHGKGVCVFGWDGSRYEGDWVYGNREGHGRLVWPDGVTYDGEWLNDRRDGYGEQTSTRGPAFGVYMGEFKQGKKNGVGKVVLDGEVIQEGVWLNNEYQRNSVVESVLAYPTKEDHYEGFVRNQKPHGKGRCVFGGSQNNNVYEGDWVDGRMEGKGTYTWPNGNKYVGDFVNNLREGEGTHTYPGGQVYTGQWKKRLREGYGTLTNRDGITIYSGEWVNDKPQK